MVTSPSISKHALKAYAYSYFVNEMEIGSIRMKIASKCAQFKIELWAELAPFSYRAFETRDIPWLWMLSIQLAWMMQINMNINCAFSSATKHLVVGIRLKILFRKEKNQIQPICFFWIMKITPIRLYIIVFADKFSSFNGRFLSVSIHHDIYILCLNILFERFNDDLKRLRKIILFFLNETSNRRPNKETQYINNK